MDLALRLYNYLTFKYYHGHFSIKIFKDKILNYKISKLSGR